LLRASRPDYSQFIGSGDKLHSLGIKPTILSEDGIHGDKISRIQSNQSGIKVNGDKMFTENLNRHPRTINLIPSHLAADLTTNGEVVFPLGNVILSP
jgi:hypothetical protein